MRTRTLLVVVILLIACVFIMTPAYAHHGPGKVTISAAAAKQAPVPFDHAKHAATYVKSCETCHHTEKGLTSDKDKDVKKCSTCHLNPKDKAPSMSEMSLTKNPFHVTCVGCHKEQKKGPTVCKDCHKK